MTVVGTGTEGVTLGVSGHRAHGSDDAAVTALVDTVLDGLGAGGRVVTSLAEGADRLVAERAAARGWAIDVVLPLAPDDYEADFAEPASRAAFRAVLAGAASVEQVAPAAAREDAYLAAGLAVLDRSDALVAVWDGQPSRGRGGTAEIVAAARARALPLAWIDVARPPEADPAAAPTLTLERWPWAR